MTAKVFISHSSGDQKVARTICTALEHRGLVCWMATRDVGPGQNYMDAIVRAIRDAKVMVLVFSQNANISSEILKELSLASKYKVNVIPARIEDVVPSEAFELEFATRQWIDLFQDWEREIDRLTSWIISIVPVELKTDAAAKRAETAAVLDSAPIAKAGPTPMIDPQPAFAKVNAETLTVEKKEARLRPRVAPKWAYSLLGLLVGCFVFLVMRQLLGFFGSPEVMKATLIGLAAVGAGLGLFVGARANIAAETRSQTPKEEVN
jgi:hypothetical protein